MAQEIVNRVAQSSLKTLDLEMLYPKGERISLDISQWLEQGLILREKPFREALKEVGWERYQDCFVALHCSTEAIVPAWAYLLISAHLQPYARRVVVGSETLLETVLFQEAIAAHDLEQYRDKPVIIKGCSHLPVPESAYLMALDRIREIARAVHYGEACSSVPILRRKTR